MPIVDTLIVIMSLHSLSAAAATESLFEPWLQSPPPRYTLLSKISEYMQCLEWIIFC